MSTGPDIATQAENQPAPNQPPLLAMSPGFSDWLASVGACVALTSYRAERLFFVSPGPEQRARTLTRIIKQCQGLWSDGQTVWVSGLYTLWRFENALAPGETTASGADRNYIPREGRITGRIDIHDIGVGDIGEGTRRPIFVNTLYSCLATVSDQASFRPLWQPKFVSALMPQDRCHLNGLAMDGARPAFVSAVGRSDTLEGWRERRSDGGVLIDVATNEIAASGLSMPHSPRLYDGRLWVLNSGTGEFGVVDPATGTFTPVCFCPGYARGLAFVGRYAVIGLSRPRNNKTFEGLPLDGRLAQRGATPCCGLLIVDIDSGNPVQRFFFQHTLEELYDVAVLPGVRYAEALGFMEDAIQRQISIEAPGARPWG